MKKLYILLFIAFSSFSYGQSPILTAVLDGPCTGGLPKVLEIYASGTVNFTQYTLQNQTNANTTWGAAQDLSALGSRTNEFVYVLLTNGNLSIATTEFPNITTSNSLESSTLNLNGDDRLRIINTTTLAVIDQFGVSDVDGTGSAWEWLDTYAKRVNGTGPDGAFVQSNWTFAAVDALDGTGLCNTSTQLSTIVNLGSYTLGVNDNAIAGLKIYPNPNTGSTLYVTSDLIGDKSVVVFDVLGKQILKVSNVTENGINIGNLKAGIYMVKVSQDGKSATRKLVVQ